MTTKIDFNVLPKDWRNDMPFVWEVISSSSEILAKEVRKEDEFYVAVSDEGLTIGKGPSVRAAVEASLSLDSETVELLRRMILDDYLISLEHALDAIVYPHLGDEEAEQYARLRRKQELLYESGRLGWSKLDWDRLHRAGKLCKKDYERFSGELDGLKWKDGK